MLRPLARNPTPFTAFLSQSLRVEVPMAFVLDDARSYMYPADGAEGCLPKRVMSASRV